MIIHDKRPDIETSSEEYAKRFSGEAGNFFLSLQREIIFRLVSSYPITDTVLDIGGGHGQIAIPLSLKGYSVTVLGSDHLACGKSVKHRVSSGQMHYLSGNFLCLPFSDNQFDIVIAFRLLPHLEKWDKLLREMSRVSKKMIVFDYPDIRSFNILYKLLFKLKKKSEKNTRPFSVFSRNQIIHALKSSDWHIHDFIPEFFIPMVLHRWLENEKISRRIERICSLSGITQIFGSPVISSFKK